MAIASTCYVIAEHLASNSDERSSNNNARYRALWGS